MHVGKVADVTAYLYGPINGILLMQQAYDAIDVKQLGPVSLTFSSNRLLTSQLGFVSRKKRLPEIQNVVLTSVQPYHLMPITLLCKACQHQAAWLGLTQRKWMS